MTTNILFIGDPHFKIDNILEVDLLIERVEKIAKEKQPDLICIGGDLLHEHERLHSIPLNKAYTFIDKLRKLSLVVVLVGNHDMVSQSRMMLIEDYIPTDKPDIHRTYDNFKFRWSRRVQLFNMNHWLNAMKKWDNVIIVDQVVELNINNSKFIFVPYVPPGRFEEALNTLDTDWKDANIIFAHQEFAGCKMGSIISVEGDRWDKNYPNVISGHIHSKQSIGNVYYPGAIMQHAFGESEINIIAYITVEGDEKEYDVQEIDLGLPRKKIVYMDVEDIDEYVLPDTEDKIKITLNGNYNDFKALKKTKKYKELVKKDVKVVFKKKRADVKKEREELKGLEDSGESDFSKILFDMIERERDNYLTEIYELVLNNRVVSRDDILYI